MRVDLPARLARYPWTAGVQVQVDAVDRHDAGEALHDAAEGHEHRALGHPHPDLR